MPVGLAGQDDRVRRFSGIQMINNSGGHKSDHHAILSMRFRVPGVVERRRAGDGRRFDLPVKLAAEPSRRDQAWAVAQFILAVAVLMMIWLAPFIVSRIREL